MGFRDLLLFYVVTGVSLRWIATAAGQGPTSLVIWFGAWLFLYIPLALSVIHLSTRFPEEGGFYVWIKKAFGERAGFLASWLYWVSNLPYFPTVLYFAAGNLLFLHPSLRHYSKEPAFFMVFSVTILAGLTLLNVLGLNLAKWAHNLGAIAMWIPATMVIVLGFVAWRQFGSATSFAPREFLPGTHFADMLSWSVMIFAFIGCETGSVMAEEIKDARRQIPRALILAGITIALCYMLGTFCVLLAIPSAESSNLEGLAQAIAQTAGRLHLHGVTEFGAFLIAISNIGAAGAYLAAASRLPFVAGIDGYLPAAFGKLHPKFKTPWVSVLGQGLFGILFVFLGQAGASVGGAYDVLVAISVVVAMFPFLLLFAAMVRLQDRERFPFLSNGAANNSRGFFESLASLPPRISAALGMVGFATAGFAIVLSLIPPSQEPHKMLYFFKLLGSTALLIVLGVGIFQFGSRGKDKVNRSQ